MGAHSAKIIASNAKASAARVLKRRTGGAPGEEPVCEIQQSKQDDMVTPIEKTLINDMAKAIDKIFSDDGIEVMSLGSNDTPVEEPYSLPGSVDDSDCSLLGSMPGSAGSDCEHL